MLGRADGDSKEVLSLFIGCQRGREIKERNGEGKEERKTVLMQTPFFPPYFIILPGFSCTLVLVKTIEITIFALTDLHILQIS